MSAPEICYLCKKPTRRLPSNGPLRGEDGTGPYCDICWGTMASAQRTMPKVDAIIVIAAETLDALLVLINKAQDSGYELHQGPFVTERETWRNAEQSRETAIGWAQVMQFP